MNYVNLNGKIISVADAIIPIDNSAFRYGYGLFETMLVENGAIRLGKYHWERLFRGLKQLYFDMPALLTGEWLEAEVLRIVKKNQSEKLCRVRLQIYAGSGGLYGTESRQPGFVIECFPLEPETLKLNDDGLVAGIATGVAKSMDSLSNLKSCNALIYAVAGRQAKTSKWNDALVCNTNGHVIESTIANIFWIKDKTIHTPPLSDGCVAGVMRRHIMEKIATKEQSLSIEELLRADEVFLTNAMKKVRWISSIDKTRYDNRQIKKLYSSL